MLGVPDDELGQIYIDYTGGGLYSDLQFRKHMEILHSNVFGNPHSANPTSLAMTDLVEDTRKYVLRYFNASPDVVKFRAGYDMRTIPLKSSWTPKIPI